MAAGGAPGAGPAVLGDADDSGLGKLLSTQPAEVFEHLFSDSPACYAVFSLLPRLAKHFVLRLLFVDDPVPPGVVRTFVAVATRNGPAHCNAERWLDGLRIWSHTDAGVSLNEQFRDGLRPVLAGGGTPWVSSGKKGGYAARIDVEVLEEWGIARWEAVLYVMVGDSGAHSTDRSVLETLFQAGLLQGIPGDHDVTKLGFQFLLRPRREQLWCYLIEYLKQPPLDQPKTQAAALSLLFRLGFSQLGEAYPVAALSKDQQNMLVHLDKLGLVQQQEEWYYPTGLASVLMGSEAADDPDQHGYLIVETNFRVFALDPTDLQVALLSKFVDIQYRFPNMTVGTLTRASVGSALVNDITADQLVKYLHSHVHPRMEPCPGTDWSPLPRAVTDQLFLWQEDTQRITVTPARLYMDFSLERDHDDTLAFVRESGHLLASNPRSKRMAVTEVGHIKVKKWRDSR